MSVEPAAVSTPKCTKGPQCFAINCYNYKNYDSKRQGVSFHLFPNAEKKSEMHRLWVRNCRRDTTPSKYALVCSDHFEAKWFDRTGQTVRLKDGAIPTIFNLPLHLQPSQKKRTTLNSKSLENEPITFSIEQEHEESSSADSCFVDMDHSYSTKPMVWKKKLEEAEARLASAKKKLRNTQRRERRAKNNCKALVEELYEKSMINMELHYRLSSYGDIPCDLFKKPVKEYSAEQKDFALTLHLQSPKAYDYLRTVAHIPLPHPRTLSIWLESVDSNPGLNTSMLEVLKNKREQSPETYTSCCLMIDAMAIRRHIDFNWHNGTHTGHVNLGNGAEAEEAKEALVFMLVGLNGGWKAPIAYFLTKGLSAETQKELVQHTINKLHDLQFQVHALTLDGHATNVSMCSLLGAKFDFVGDGLFTYINTQQLHKTFVIFDVCHMLKLLRNTLHDFGGFDTPDGPVSWNYLHVLNNIQEEEGLRLANKLTSKHIIFQKQKMKVSLAAQLFSSSVAKALRTLIDIGDSRFEGCLPTALFIERIDRLFDVLNSRSPMGKGNKSPISKLNLVEVEAFLRETEAYLMNVKMPGPEGLPVLATRRSMCLKGLIIAIESVVGVAKQILATQKYLLTYKLSQDHLELFFNAVRRCGGWNNNPTSKTFEASFKKIMSHCGALKVSKAGNCQVLDDTCIIQTGTSTYIPPDAFPQQDEDCEETICDEHEAALMLDHSYSSESLSLFTLNVVVYISGWIIKKLSSQLSCETCKRSLHANENDVQLQDKVFSLIKNKQKGGLLMPSQSLVFVVMSTEKHMRRMSDLNKANPSLNQLRLQTCVLADCLAVDIFDSSHSSETQEGVENHVLSLIRSIVSLFFKLRQSHIVRLHNL